MIHVKSYFKKLYKSNTQYLGMEFPDVTLDITKIKIVIINEMAPFESDDDFYGKKNMPRYLLTAIPLLHEAGVNAKTIDEAITKGIYFTNALKIPLSDNNLSKETIELNANVLEGELNLFPNLEVVVLMGDVAIDVFNMLAQKKSSKTIVPTSMSSKLRELDIYYNKIRIIPTRSIMGIDIMTEKSKFAIVARNIKKAVDLVKGNTE